MRRPRGSASGAGGGAGGPGRARRLSPAWAPGRASPRPRPGTLPRPWPPLPPPSRAAAPGPAPRPPHTLPAPRRVRGNFHAAPSGSVSPADPAPPGPARARGKSPASVPPAAAPRQRPAPRRAAPRRLDNERPGCHPAAASPGRRLPAERGAAGTKEAGGCGGRLSHREAKSEAPCGTHRAAESSSTCSGARPPRRPPLPTARGHREKLMRKFAAETPNSRAPSSNTEKSNPSYKIKIGAGEAKEVNMETALPPQYPARPVSDWHTASVRMNDRDIVTVTMSGSRVRTPNLRVPRRQRSPGPGSPAPSRRPSSSAARAEAPPPGADSPATATSHASRDSARRPKSVSLTWREFFPGPAGEPRLPPPTCRPCATSGESGSPLSSFR
ncbi:serine/arginine repetitive matrix protein 1-like [Sorex fumeus]|uniref:serine/arginine repetitive matrix protein 1-like n=1 Tax=Sorex fumeus TaxID=62283 RepID=UPI0024ADAC5B|nr:serine/arginine repetitive matrix protein 1-like [Sorex fumeus]